MLGQIVEGAEVASQILQNRSETLIVIVIGFVLVGFVLWRDSKQREKEDDRADRREESMRVKDERDSETMRLIAGSTDRTAKAVEMFADTVDKMEQRQDRDRRAILSIIESVDAKSNGDEEKAKSSLRDARSILIGRN